jgi:hypothetical protein
MKLIYEARINTSCDGRGPGKVLGYFINKYSALAAVEGKSAYNKNGTIETVHLYEDMDDFNENCRDAVRRRAIAKLTPEEIDALGLIL